MVKSFSDKMKFQFNKTYTILATILFLTEAGIAIFFKTGFIRHTVGDFLVVILIYCSVKSLMNFNSVRLAIAVFLFALLIELLQLLNILSLLHLENNKAAILLLGSHFHISDLAAYFLGMATFLLIDLLFISNE